MSSKQHRAAVFPSGSAGHLALIIVMGTLLGAQPALHAQRVAASSDGAASRFYPDDPLWLDPDTTDVPSVSEFDLFADYDFVQHSFGDPGGPDGPSLNINTLDEVPDSSWFTNRIGRREMAVAEVVRGPDTGLGPAPGVWLLTGRPAAGITPKFTIRDAQGDTYLIKLDPPAFPELASAAETISTKILHAIGYHVPENYVIDLDPARLDIAPDATFRTHRGTERPIQRADVEYWLKDQIRNPDGTIRALASRFIPGRPVGQYRYYGTRRDDPNDIYPHEYHRQLRGLRVFAAWLNHDDTKALNSFDAYVEDEGRRYIRHYLLDFGATLGSGSTHSKRPKAGYEYYVEGDKILKGIFTFGLWKRPWTKVRYPDYPSVGRYEAEFFEPWLWKPKYPNPAFDRMDAADAFWAARIVSRFTDEMIRAIVAAGKISDPAAAAYLTDVLIKRRDKVVHHWISRTNPLDRFDVHSRADLGWQLTFDNAAVRVGAAPEGARYIVHWSALDNLSDQEQPRGQVELWGARAGVPHAAWGPADDAGDRYAVAAIATLHPEFSHWERPVVVTLRDRAGDVSVVGIERPSGDPDNRH